MVMIARSVRDTRLKCNAKVVNDALYTWGITTMAYYDDGNVDRRDCKMRIIDLVDGIIENEN